LLNLQQISSKILAKVEILRRLKNALKEFIGHQNPVIALISNDAIGSMACEFVDFREVEIAMGSWIDFSLEFAVARAAIL
jgi:hypothetical protein